MRTLLVAAAAAAMTLLAACATSPPPPAKQRFIGQVLHLASTDEADHGFRFVPDSDEWIGGLEPQSFEAPPPTSMRKACGDLPQDARFALVLLYYYQAADTPHPRMFAPWVVVDSKVPVEQDNIVELEARATPSGSRCVTLRSVRAAGPADAQCEYRLNTPSTAVGFLNGLAGGGPAAASIRCPFLTDEHWQQVPLGPLPPSMGGVVWARVPAD